MATKQIGPIQFQGKLGNIVGRTTRKGYMSLGIKAASVTNPQTPKQVVQRVKFGAAQNLSNGIPMECLAGFTRYAKSHKMSIRNAVVRAYTGGINGASTAPNFNDPKDAFTITGDGGMGTTKAQLDPTKMAFSIGINQLMTPALGDLDWEIPNKMSMTIPDQTFVMGDKDYITHVIAYIPAMELFIHTTAPKEQSVVTIDFPDAALGNKTYIYAYLEYNEYNDTNVDYTQYPTASQADRMAMDAASSFTKTCYCGFGTPA